MRDGWESSCGACGGGAADRPSAACRRRRTRASAFPVVAVGAALLLLCAIALLLRADSGHGQGGNRILPPPAAAAAAAPARGSCLVPARAAERFQSTTRRRVVALTFDDGPGAVTASVLAQLRRARQHATFFVIGRQVAARAGVLARAVRDGNAIGNHTWDHADVSAGDAAAAGELLWTSRAIRRATGAPPCVLRAPYGRSGPGLVAAARAQGMVVTEWNVDPQDWRSPSPARTARAVLSALRPGRDHPAARRRPARAGDARRAAEHPARPAAPRLPVADRARAAAPAPRALGRDVPHPPSRGIRYGSTRRAVIRAPRAQLGASERASAHVSSTRRSRYGSSASSRARRARMRLLRALCSSSARPSASSTGGT